MSAFRIFSRFADLLDIKITRAAAAWLRLNADGTVSERTAAETLADLGGISGTALGITYLSASTTSGNRNNNTLAADDVLAGIALEANTNYRLEFSLAFSASASSGFRWRFYATSSSTHAGYHCGTAATPSATTQPLYMTASTGYTDAITRAASATGFTYSGFLVFRTGAAAGVLSLEWGQNSTDAAQTATRLAQSWLQLTKIGAAP